MNTATKQAQPLGTPLNDPTVYHVGAEPTFVFVPGIVKPLAVGNRERAAFIVRACNAHDDLLASAKSALVLLDQQRDEYNSALSVMPRPDAEEGPIAKSLRAAIARAES